MNCNYANYYLDPSYFVFACTIPLKKEQVSEKVASEMHKPH